MLSSVSALQLLTLKLKHVANRLTTDKNNTGKINLLSHAIITLDAS